MSKFNKGDKIQGTTLSVLSYISDSRIRCKCSECNQGEFNTYVSMVYNESDLISGKATCRFCLEKSKAKENGIYTHRDIYMEMLAKSSPTDILLLPKGTRCLITDEFDLELKDKDIAVQFPLGKEYGELVSIAYLTTIRSRDEYGVHYTKPTMIALKCRNCGYITFVEFKNINKVVHVCPLCNNLKNQSILAEKKKREKQLLRDAEKSQERDFQSVKTEFSKIQTNKAMQKNVKTLEEKNKGYKVVDIRKSGGATVYHLVCEKCGSVVTCMRSNARIKECEFCKQKEENKDYTKMGYLYKDYTGTIFNGLRVVSQAGLTCEVECVRCKKRRVGVSLYSVISRNCFCDCELSKVRDFSCPECYTPLQDKSFKEIYTTEISYKCTNCGREVVNSDYLLEMSGMDYTNSLRSKLNMANSKISGNTIKSITFGNSFASDCLVTEKEPVYRGNDEQGYYRCFCKEHNVGLVLSEGEIKDYNHQYCDDLRQKIIANPDANSIKLS